MTDKMREEFEVAVLNSELLPCNSIIKLEGGNEYSSVITGVAWLSWQISRASLCVELPKYYSTDSIGLAYCTDAVVDSLDAAGVSYK